MGLKKPIKTGPVLPSLDELSAVDATPVEADGYVVLDTVPGQDCSMESNTPISIKAELGKFGNATAADVASGKTFTSAAGLKVAGTGSSISIISEYSIPSEKAMSQNKSPGAKGIKIVMADDVEIIVGYSKTTSTNFNTIAILYPRFSSSYRFYVKDSINTFSLSMDSSAYNLTLSIKSLHEISW